MAPGGQRGITGNWTRSKLLINGMDVNLLATFEAFVGNQFALDNVERIEVIQGPGSVVYGNNAFSGMINIVTKTESTQGLHATVSPLLGVGQDGLLHQRYHARLHGIKGDWTYHLSLGHTHLHDVDVTNFVKSERFSQVNRELRVTLLESGQEPYRDFNRAQDAHLALRYAPRSGREWHLEALHLYERDG
ncbi:MAG: TonB-dependent receptor plug domain-containing protein, partial [Cytophagales bacterium]|nr:TonB-dependent receptor plug domain-containing protein [Cytophagales bacterium]